MAITKQARQITWAGANSTTIAAGGTDTSDVVTPGADAVGAVLMCKAVNGGTPASGDTLDIYLMMSTGDPDAEPDVADEFPTANHGMFLMRLDTNADSTAIASVEIPTAMKAYKIYAVSNAATNGITLSAQVYEQNAA